MPPNDFEFLLFDGFSNLVLASAMEPLRDVHRRRGLAGWTVSTLDGRAAVSSSGIRIAPDQAFNPTRPGRRLFLVSGYQMRALVQPALMADLRQAARRAELVIALDTAPWLLAAAGLLEGRQATIHWQEFDAFAEAFPNLRLSPERHVRAGPFLTCGGASTAMDLMLALIGELYGAAAAFEASSMFADAPGRPGGSEPLAAAIDVIAETVETPLKTPELAARVGTSERTLTRLFRRELGVSPGKYAALYRLRHAKYLAEETRLSLEDIALRCGYASAPSLCRCYKAQFGVTLRG